MANYVDFFLGGFLILCGFVLSLLNLTRIVKKTQATIPKVLLSENILLTCIGIAFITRSVYEPSPVNNEMSDIEERSVFVMKTDHFNCNFISTLMRYGPLIVSLVNSFLSLIIDNYMHYRMIADVKTNEDVNEVRELNNNFSMNTGFKIQNLFSFMKKYFTFIAVTLQWILPASLALAMYLIDVKKMTLMNGERSYGKSCMALLDNDTYYADTLVTTAPLLRRSKQNFGQKCMNICYLDNKNLLLYMFGVSVVSFFVPITISTIILTKIHMMNIKNKNVKTYVNRELLYNILFWTPVMFDALFSITLCSYTMNGMRTSIFNVIANVYQAVKNFVNAKYFKDNNSIVPV